MKTSMFVLTFYVLGQAALAQDHDRLGVFVGASHFVTDGEVNTYSVKPNGVSEGLLVPVHLSSVLLFVKIKVVHHGAYFESRTLGTYERYIQASNSLLVGVKSWRGREYTVEVLLGPGIQNESVYPKWGEGASAAEAFAEMSVFLTKQFGRQRLGLMASFERGFSSEEVRLAANRRFQLGVLTIF